jgi:hypothetical protein
MSEGTNRNHKESAKPISSWVKCKTGMLTTTTCNGYEASILNTSKPNGAYMYQLL